MDKTVKINPELMDPDKFDEHQIEEAAETLLKAEEIKKDAKLMERVHEFLDGKTKKITSLKQLREAASKFSDDEEDDSDDSEEEE